MCQGLGLDLTLLILRSVLLFHWDSLVVNFKNDTEKLFPSIYNKVNKIVKKHVPYVRYTGPNGRPTTVRSLLILLP